MELSQQVKISLENAEKNLREALSFASKVEEPKINMAIAQIIEATCTVKNFYERPSNPMEDAIRRHFGGI